MPDGTITRLKVVDMHTSGEPVRIVVEGYPALSGATILDKRREAQTQHDALRRALMLEPRGHTDMYGVIPVAPTHPEAVFAALFTHNEGYSTMCGHATIALGKWLVESGRVAVTGPETRFAIELPCGLVRLRCTVEDGHVAGTAFDSVPAFLAWRDAWRDVLLDVPGLGKVACDLAYGGAFYTVLPSSRIGLDFFETPLEQLVAAGKAITEEGRRTLDIVHRWHDPDRRRAAASADLEPLRLRRRAGGPKPDRQRRHRAHGRRSCEGADRAAHPPRFSWADRYSLYGGGG